MKTVLNSVKTSQSNSASEEKIQNIPTEVSLTMRGKQTKTDSYDYALNRAKKYENNDQIEKAIENYINAIQIAGESMNGLAWLYFQNDEKHIDDALSLVRIAVSYNPQNANFKDTLAEILFKKGSYKEALKVKKEASILDSRYKKDIKRFLKAAKSGTYKIEK